MPWKLPCDRVKTAVFLAAFSLAIIFALYTNLAWDDWYITFRASKNLALGNGLQFTPGQRLHSFTSPLGTLIPAGLSWLTGNGADTLVLWLFRFCGAICFAGAAVILLQLARRLRMAGGTGFLLVALFVLDIKTIANSVNGMETAFMVLCFAATIYHLLCRGAVIIPGMLWAGLQWTRPDGFVYLLCLLAGAFLFRPGVLQNRARMAILASWSRSGLVALACYAPWLIWAQAYYGSVIPNTIVAKGLVHTTEVFTGGVWPLAGQIWLFLQGRTSPLEATLMPPYINFGGWAGVTGASWLLTWLSTIIWAVPLMRAPARAFSFAAWLAQLYLAIGMTFPYPWYYPPAALLTILVIATSFDQALAAASRAPVAASMRRAAVVSLKSAMAALLLASVLLFAAASYELRAFQAVIYERNYKACGFWLRDHAASPRDTVFLEPLGYIGFFSGLKMYDYPGLSSPEVIAARRHFPPHSTREWDTFADLIPYLKPDWLVLRPADVTRIGLLNPDVLSHQYAPVKTFDASAEIASYRFLPGRPWFMFDHNLSIYRRVADAPAAPRDTRLPPPDQK